ncbi:MAG: YceI family protein [Pyrinomonadaceae bacterium]
MHRKVSVFVLLLSLFSVSAALAAERYEIDTAHTFVTFTIDHLGLSKAKGSFRDVTGAITYDPKDISKSAVEVNIKTASINTNNEGRDKHLRSPDFFDAEKYPEMTFKSKRVEKRGADYVAIGDLTIHGVTKEVQMPFKLTGPVKDMGGNMRMGVDANLKVNRQDFGITWSKTLDTGGLLVGNEVSIDISLEAAIPKPKAE